MKSFFKIIALVLVVVSVFSAISALIRAGVDNSISNIGGGGGSANKPVEESDTPVMNPPSDDGYITLGTADYFGSVSSLTLSDDKQIEFKSNFTDLEYYTDSIPNNMYCLIDSQETFGENLFDYDLPNYESGVYRLSVDTVYVGSSEDVIPEDMLIYLKTPGYFNSTSVLELTPDVIAEAKRQGFTPYIWDPYGEASYAIAFRFEFSFDFNNNSLTASIVDKNGSRYIVNEAVSLNEYEDGMKYHPITLRFHILDGTPMNESFMAVGYWNITYQHLENSTSDEEWTTLGSFSDLGYTIDEKLYLEDDEIISTSKSFADFIYYTGSGGYEPAGFYVSRSIGEKYNKNDFDIHLPNHSSGVFKFELDEYYMGEFDDMFLPYRNYILKSPGYLNLTSLFSLTDEFLYSLEAEGFYFGKGSHSVEDMGYIYHFYGTKILHFEYIFDFDNDFITVKLYDLNGRSKDIATKSLSSYLGDMKELAITLRISIPGDTYEVNPNNAGFAFYNPTYSYRVPSEPEKVIEGDFEILGSGNGFENSTIYNLGNGSISTNCVLSDFTVNSEVHSRFDYTGAATGKYGENSFNIDLPNYESGVYVLTLDLYVYGSTDFFYPTYLGAYLKSPGYLNVTDLFCINQKIVKLASLAGYDFTFTGGGSFKIEFTFDFDKDIIYSTLYDLNGKSYSLDKQSLSSYRIYEGADTKSKAITLRFQIPPDEYDVNLECTALEFGTWTYKKLIQE